MRPTLEPVHEIAAGQLPRLGGREGRPRQIERGAVVPRVMLVKLRQVDQQLERGPLRAWRPARATRSQRLCRKIRGSGPGSRLRR